MATILIIDDDQQFRSVLKRMLEQLEHTVIEAENGCDALEVFKEHRSIQLIITDLVMPEKDGIMTIQEIKGLNPAARIIAISGGPGGNTAWLPIAKRAGAMRVLRKPFTQESLVSAISDTMSGSIL